MTVAADKDTPRNHGSRQFLKCFQSICKGAPHVRQGDYQALDAEVAAPPVRAWKVKMCAIFRESAQNFFRSKV
jgi:hypothetical protein